MEWLKKGFEVGGTLTGETRPKDMVQGRWGLGDRVGKDGLRF